MSTIDSKEVVRQIIAGDFADDRPTSVVRYMNAWGQHTYGVTFGRQPRGIYLEETRYVQNPKLIWQIEDGYQPNFNLEG